MKNFVICILLVVITMLSIGGCGGALSRPIGYKLVYSQNFDDPKAIGDFEFSDYPAFSLGQQADLGFSLQVSGKSSYKPPVRSPRVIALLSDRIFGDFTLQADIMQTGKEYGHRDMCIFFDITDASHFYYAHIASTPDKVSHTIHIVDGKDRTSIATYRSDGVEWGDGIWHRVKLVRKMDGPIKVYFDGILIMKAEDTTLGAGYIGFGSFDDEGKIDNIKIYANKMLKKKSLIFK